jgi:hypothetical protein
MPMLCPKCRGAFDQRWTCPTCSIRLVYESGPRRKVGESGGDEQLVAWGNTPWGRILVGILLSQGLYYGLRQVCNAFLLVRGDEAPDVWTTLIGIVFLQILQAIGLMAGGVLAGAGLRQGAMYGGIVGVWNGVLAVILQSGLGTVPSAVMLIGQPLLHTAFGALGGLLGLRIWKPIPVIAPLAGPQASPLMAPAKPRRPLFDGPFCWGRILLGSAVAIAGATWTGVVLEFILDNSNGSLDITDNLQAQLVTWEVTGLAMLAGSALAGAGTFNSLKQGLSVGMAAAVVLLGMRFATKTHLDFPDMLLTAICSIALGVAGAWFGGSLFPPLTPAVRKQKLREAA